jgi:preprotein translocase subunit SecG
MGPQKGQFMAQQWLPALRIVGIIFSVAVILFVLLQTRSAGLGSAFGGSSAGSVFKTRRGIERLVFNLTIIFITLFALFALLSAVAAR